jgi:hypothetical protein
MKTSLVVAILSTFALVATTQASNFVRRGVAEEKKTRSNRMLKGTEEDSEEEDDLDVYFSLISAAQNVAPCMSQASGNALATLNVATSELCIKLSYSGLSGTELFSHIHGPAKIGANAGVLFTLSLDTIKTDCFILNSEQMEYLEDGYLYFNIHSTMCPSGEIRGQILEM